MRQTLVILFAVVALAGAADANAQLTAKHWCAKTNVSCINHRQLQNLKHARYVCHHGAHQNKRWNCAAVSWLKREYNQTMAVLHPRVSASSHWAGWNCITTGDGHPGQAHEGNGYNGSYTGRLGMTTPWAGHYPSTGDWVTASASEVYGVAEAEAKKHSWSYSWMHGQWPNTFPPCAGYFN